MKEANHASPTRTVGECTMDENDCRGHGYDRGGLAHENSWLAGGSGGKGQAGRGSQCRPGGCDATEHRAPGYLSCQASGWAVTASVSHGGSIPLQVVRGDINGEVSRRHIAPNTQTSDLGVKPGMCLAQSGVRSALKINTVRHHRNSVATGMLWRCSYIDSSKPAAQR
jgi:hypothetical protein